MPLSRLSPPRQSHRQPPRDQDLVMVILPWYQDC